ncbi:Arc family DNA-binding protein [Pseudorhodoferax sp. Leaf274]|uniref:Arc family DNA-binding protein n=1 Tax=Pseudorhodoferax sp. Leaf274 TaxID=1736318 RepID=UPI0009EB406B|nr:Arc family DNA-binding protein [Pseudorhodoferax sp. Leaf274]
MSREDPQLKIRLPAELKDRIEAASDEAGRSMNAEIVARLTSSFEPAGQSGDVVKHLAYRLAEAEHRAAQFALSSHAHQLDLALVSQHLQEALDANELLGQELMTRGEREEFDEIASQAIAAITAISPDVYMGLVVKTEEAEKNLAAAKRMLEPKQPAALDKVARVRLHSEAKRTLLHEYLRDDDRAKVATPKTVRKRISQK